MWAGMASAGTNPCNDVGGLAVEAAEGDEVDEDDAAEENALATTSSPKAVAAKRPRKQQAVKFLDAAEEVDSLAMHRSVCFWEVAC